MKSKIDYKDLMITTILEAVSSGGLSWLVGSYIILLIFGCFFGPKELHEIPIPVVKSSMFYTFMLAFFIHFYKNYRLQKNIIKHSLLQTFNHKKL